MAETLVVKEIENCFDTNTQEMMMMCEEGSVETVLLVKDVGDVKDVVSVALKGQEECVSKTKEVPKPPSVSSRRHSTGAIGTRGAKVEVQSRFRGNHHVPSTHDLCKHGKLRDSDDVVKPWKVVRRRSVEGSEVVKVETSGLRRTSLGGVSRQTPGCTKPESYVSVKRDALAVKKRPCASVSSETSSVKEDREMARSVDGLSVRSSDKARKNKGTESTMSGGLAVVKRVLGLGSEKSDSAMKKVSRIIDAESSNVSALKNKEKEKAQTISCEDVKEKTVCVVEASVKGVQSEKQASSEKKTMTSRLKSLATPKHGSAYHSPTKQVPDKVSTNEKKESGDAELVTNHKPEKKIRPKKTGVKITLAKQLSSKKDASPKRIKFLKRVVQELETQTEESKKKNLMGVETKSDSCEGSKREKVVLRRRNVQGKKKMMTLFNNVIEETMNKLIKVRKTKVKALIGAFETVISLQDTKTPQGVQSKDTISESKVSPLGFKQ